MVRAGEGGARAQSFWDKGCVAIGFDLPDLKNVKSREELERIFRESRQGQKDQKTAVALGQCTRFVFDFQLDDWVVTYHNERRQYYLGRIASLCEHRPGLIEDLETTRRVKWQHQAQRDRLSTAARNSLGSLMTVFRVEQAVLEELLAAATGLDPDIIQPPPVEDIDQLRQDSAERGRGFITDRIMRLDWDEMQELVAGLLRSMGYKTRVSHKGPDRGCDILASPDGLGLSAPRIIVEVKHQPNTQIGSQQIRSFLGGRRQGDNGLYVSTGGFTKDGRYEAERANIPLTLVETDGLVDLLVQHYPSLDPETRALVPLIPVYWPVG